MMKPWNDTLRGYARLAPVIPVVMIEDARLSIDLAQTLVAPACRSSRSRFARARRLTPSWRSPRRCPMRSSRRERFCTRVRSRKSSMRAPNSSSRPGHRQIGGTAARGADPGHAGLLHRLGSDGAFRNRFRYSQVLSGRGIGWSELAQIRPWPVGEDRLPTGGIDLASAPSYLALPDLIVWWNLDHASRPLEECRLRRHPRPGFASRGLAFAAIKGGRVRAATTSRAA